MMNYDLPSMEVPLITPKVLVSARLLYTPQQSRILREFIITHNDELPDLPWLFDFISFWRREIDGTLRRVEWMWGVLGNNHVRHPAVDRTH